MSVIEDKYTELAVRALRDASEHAQERHGAPSRG
jgi:hypothetical protein